MKFLIIALALAGCASDKQLHFAAGGVAAGLTYAAGGSVEQSCAMAGAAGVAKEAWDATGRGTPDAGDVLATLAGCGLVWAFDRVTR